MINDEIGIVISGSSHIVTNHQQLPNPLPLVSLPQHFDGVCDDGDDDVRDIDTWVHVVPHLGGVMIQTSSSRT